MTEDSKNECQLRLDSQEKPKLGVACWGRPKKDRLKRNYEDKKGDIYVYQTTIFSLESIEYDY